MELAGFEIVAIIVLSLVAGAINTIAGGGSNLVVPTLMIFGMPPEVANATNRVGIWIESVVAVSEFRRHKKLETFDLKAILIPIGIGGLFGALVAAFAPSEILKPLLIGTMLTMSCVVLVRPAVISPPSGTQILAMKDTPVAWLGLFIAGFYGGFVQAGVGFLLLAALAGTLKYDMVRANALKLVCTLVFTTVSLVIFIWQDQVDWQIGLILSVGYVAGAFIGVKMAVFADPHLLRWIVFGATVLAGGAALFTS